MLGTTLICKHNDNRLRLHKFGNWERIIVIYNGVQYNMWARPCLNCNGYTEPTNYARIRNNAQ